MRKKQETLLHFVGIGGIGMSGIAEVFLTQGYRVSGSDLAESWSTQRLEKLGARIALGHRAENIQGAHVVVYSSAVKATNPELAEAKRLRIPTIPRAEMLGELMRGKTGVAVAGTHGKTSTTSMMATVFASAGMDPTVVIGGRLDSIGSNAKLGQGAYVIAEADESDGSFLHLPAAYGVITNIDNDHLDHYGSITKVEDAFVEFVGKLPFYGAAAVCGDDPGVKRCMSRFTKPVLTYGMSEDANFFARDVKTQGAGSDFEVMARGMSGASRPMGRVILNVPGRHNVLNALAVIALATQMDLPFDKIAKGLGEYRGVKRRFEVRWKDEARNRLIVDDYGHHPTEIAATLAAARSFWPGRIVVIFQPHRYSRTLHCRDGFLSAFRNADVVCITDIYAAGEEPIEGVTAEALVQDIRGTLVAGQEVKHVKDLETAKNEILSRFSDGDLVLCMGAGTITKLPDQLMEGIRG